MIHHAAAGCLGPPPAPLRRTLYAGWREVYGCWYPPSPPGEECMPALIRHGYPPPGPAALILAARLTVWRRG